MQLEAPSRPRRTARRVAAGWVCAALALIAARATAPARAQTSYAAVDCGAAFIDLRAINKRGQIVGESAGIPAIWTEAEGLRQLHGLPNALPWFPRWWMPPGGDPSVFYGAACGVNGLGQTVGYVSATVGFIDAMGVLDFSMSTLADRAFLWDPAAASSMQDLGTLGEPYRYRPELPGYPAGLYSHANAINDRGQVAGYADVWQSDTGSATIRQPAVYAGGAWHALGLGPGGVGSGEATGINSQGVVVGTLWVPDPQCQVSPYGAYLRAFTVRPLDTDGDGIADTWFQDLDGDGSNDLMTLLPGPVGLGTQAAAVNDQGDVLLTIDTGEFDPAGDPLTRAGVWHDANGNGVAENEEIVSVPPLPGDQATVAYGLNNLGQVIGDSWINLPDGSYQDEGFVWDATHGVRSLDTMLPAGCPFSFVVGGAINDNGEISAGGYNVQTGEPVGLLLKPVSDTITVAPGQTATDVSVTPPVTDAQGNAMASTLSVSFAEATGSMQTSVQALSGTPDVTSVAAPVGNFAIQAPSSDAYPTYLDIATDVAAFTSTVTITDPATGQPITEPGVELTLAYDPALFPYNASGATDADQWPNGKPSLWHLVGATKQADGTYAGGTWTDITVAINTESHIVTGRTSSFSPFAVLGLQVDTTPPVVSIASPADGAILLVNAQAAAGFSATDDLSGVASLVGSIAPSGLAIASGAALETGTAGARTLTVTATDRAGNAAVKSVSYTVSYSLAELYDHSKVFKLGSTIPLKLKLVDAAGANVSSSDVCVHATGYQLVGTDVSGTPEDAGSANPDNDFRYDTSLTAGGGYIYNLKTTGLASGKYLLTFTAGDDPVVHSILFQVK